jgi:hypothetical protein
MIAAWQTNAGTGTTAQQQIIDDANILNCIDIDSNNNLQL